MFTNNKLSKAVRLAVAFGAASTAVFTGAVVAQEAEEAKKLNVLKLLVHVSNVLILKLQVLFKLLLLKRLKLLVIPVLKIC